MRKKATNNEVEAQRRLDEYLQRQEKVASEMRRLRKENGFIRGIRESMGPL